MQNKDIQITPLAPHLGSVINSTKAQSLFDLDLDLVIDSYRKTGAVLFRGFKASVEDFIRFSEQLSQSFATYKGGAMRYKIFDRKQVNNNPTVLTTSGGSQGFPVPLHGELYYFKNRPSMVWFYCQQPPTSKGESTLCDAVQLFNELTPQTQSLLREKKIKYIRHLSREDWPITFQTHDLDEVQEFCHENGTSVTINDDQSLTTEFICSPLVKTVRGEAFINSLVFIYFVEWAFESGWVQKKYGINSTQPPIVVRLEDGSRISNEIIEDIQQTSQKLQTAISWEKGDFVTFNNIWLLHGRSESDGSKRMICARFGEPRF